MRTKFIFGLLLVAGTLAVTLLVLNQMGQSARLEARQPDAPMAAARTEALPQEAPAPVPPLHRPAPPEAELAAQPAWATRPPATSTNRLDRLAQIRENFRALAAGDPALAMRAAKQITDETERETALLTLVTEWTKGNLRSPQERARSVADFGLEAGLGIELAGNPDLAVAWASELLDSPGRTALIGATATTMVGSNAAAAFALSGQVPEADRRKFLDDVFAGWASHDTDAALQWVDQVSDPAEREADLAAIRTAAPVGIGAALMIQDGYPVIKQLLPGAASELSGQLHPGDRIVALAEGGNSFLDTRGLALQDVVQMIRGAPGTVLQLQVLSTDALANSPPRTVPIIRTQIKLKQ